MGAAAVSAGVGAHVEQPLQRRVGRGLVAATLPDHLPQADALAPDAWKRSVAGQGRDVVGRIALLGLHMGR